MGEKAFYIGVDLTIKRATELGMMVDMIENNALTVEQEAHMQHILSVRHATVGVVLKIDGFTYMAYDDPRYTPKISYLQWTDKGWATPTEDAWNAIKKANMKRS